MHPACSAAMHHRFTGDKFITTVCPGHFDICIKDKVLCVILDNGAKGEHNKGVQRLVEKQGITEISAVAITEEMYFSSDNYQYNLYPIADRIFADFEDFECHKLFFNDKIFVFENMEISRVENGFSIDIESENIIISKNEFSLGGVKYSFAESDYPWELVYRDNKFEVRRFDYGFDEQ